MHKLWLIASHEYARSVFKKSFILLLFSLPAVIGLMFGIAIVMESRENSSKSLGYVDEAGLLSEPIYPPRRAGSPDSPTTPKHVGLVAFDSREQATAALAAKEIQAYYAIPADYRDTNHVELVFVKSPGRNATGQFWDFMQINHLGDLPADVARRAVAGTNVVVRWPDEMPGGGREFSQQNFVGNFVPMMAVFAFLLLLMSSSSFLVQAVSEEKENRTMEVVVTSVSPGQLVAGKVLGVVAIALTQVAVWGIFAVLAVQGANRWLGIGVAISLELGMVMAALGVALPAFVMMAALLVAVGSTVADAQEASQMSGFAAIPLLLPLWLASAFLDQPDGPLAIILSIVPPLSVTTLGLRLMVAPVPIWQIVVSAGAATVAAAGALFVAGRAFRLGMLRYGQRISLRQILGGRRRRMDRSGDANG